MAAFNLQNFFSSLPQQSMVMGRINPFSPRPIPGDLPQVQPPTSELSALDRYRQALMEFPERENPSRWRRVGAGLMGALTGLGGANAGQAYEAATQFRDEPYNRRLQDFGTRTGILGAAAQAESSSYDTYRKLIEAQDSHEESLANRGKTAAETAEIQGVTPKAQAEINRIEAEIAKIDTDIASVNGRTPEGRARIDQMIANANKAIRDTLNADLPDSEKQRLVFQQAQSLERLRQQGASKLEGQRQPNRLEVARAQGSGRVQPTQSIAARQGALQDVLLNNPEYQKFVDSDGNIISNPDVSWMPFHAGDSSAEYGDFLAAVSEAEQKILGRATDRTVSAPTTPRVENPTTPRVTNPNAPTLPDISELPPLPAGAVAPPGEVIVWSVEDNGYGTMPIEEYNANIGKYVRIR